MRPRPLGALAAGLAALIFAAVAAPPAPAAVRAGANFPLLPDRNPVHGRDAVGLAVDPRDKTHTWAVYGDWARRWSEAAPPQNAGRTWRRLRLKAPAAFIDPPCTVGGHLSGQLDASIAFGKGRSVYTTFSSGIVRPDGEIEGQSVLVAKSTNGGRSFATGVVAMKGGPTGAQGPDYILPKLLVRPGAGSGGKDRIYVVAGASQQSHDDPKVTEEYTALTVSHDGGSSWSAPRTVSPTDQNAIEHSQPVLGKGGKLHITWRTRGRGARRGTFVPEGELVTATSRDGGNSWDRVKVADVRGYVYEGPPQPPFSAGQSFTASTFPRMAADRKAGNLYLVYGDGKPSTPGKASAADHFIHPDMDVWFQRSSDGGATWTAPERLNRGLQVPTEITQTRHPNIVVAPGGRVDVVWNDRRHWYRGCTHTHASCDEARLQDIYYRSSRDGGRSWQPEHRITDRSINGDVGFDYRFGAYWDFGPFIVPRGRHEALIAWMDSRDGNPDTDSQGIYLAHLDTRAPSAPPVERLRARSREDLAIQMAQRAYPGGPEAVLAGTFASRPFSRVVIVNRKDAVGALTGGVLARANLGPVLPSPADGLSSAVKNELLRLQPVGAYVIGGEASLSARVVADLAATGIPADQITRISAPGDAAGTAALIADAMDRRSPAARREGRAAFNAAILVNPNSPDAVAASVLAANRRLPVLLTGADSVPASTAAALKSLGITRTLLVGSTRWIGAGVAAQVPSPQRLGGSTSHRTSRQVLAESVRRGVPDNIVYGVRAKDRMAAALLGSTLGRSGALLLLTEKRRSAARTVAQLKRKGRTHRIVVVRRR